MSEVCRYKYADGKECATPIVRDDTSLSGWVHAEGREWLHWASPKEYGPQNSAAVISKHD